MREENFKKQAQWGHHVNVNFCNDCTLFIITCNYANKAPKLIKLRGGGK